jgi:tetrahydromethanopterin S-methyltransferase subunit G
MQTIVLLAVTIYVWIKSRSQVNTNRIEDVEKTLADHDKRLTQAVGDDDLDDIHKRLNGISRDLSNMQGEFKSNNRLLHSIDDFLRNQGTSK